MQILLVKILFMLVFLLPSKFMLVKKIEADARYIRTDNFGQLYIYANNSLYKYNKQGVLLNEFNNQMQGTITGIDVSDPYILMLFYKDLNQIVFLDDKLSPIGSPLRFDELGLFSVSTACKSKQFAIWIYDRFNNRLIQYGFNPKAILREINLDPLGMVNEIVFMRESGNYLVLNTGRELLVFDQFGSFIKSIEAKTEKNFQLQNKRVVYFKNNRFITKSIELDKTDSLAVDFIPDVDNALIEGKQLYIQKKDTVSIYRDAN